LTGDPQTTVKKIARVAYPSNGVPIGNSECVTPFHKVNVSSLVFDQGLVTVDFGANFAKGNVCKQDSGADIFRPDMVPLDALTSDSSPVMITLESAFGESVSAHMINLSCSLVNNDGRQIKRTVPVLITCGVTSKLVGPYILQSKNDYDTLLRASDGIIPQVELITGTVIMYNDPYVTHDYDSRMLKSTVVDKLKSLDVDVVKRIDSNSDVHKLGPELTREQAVECYRKAQASDKTLSECWNLSKEPASDFGIRIGNNLLYSNQIIGVFKISELVLPLENKKRVMEVAPDFEWAGHFGVKKTTQRIESHFYWPTMKSDINLYVKSCIPCQKRT